MKRLNFVYYLSIAVLVVAGILFVKAHRIESTSKIVENLKDKDTIFYSSNFKRAYINHTGAEIDDMDKLCMDGANYFKGNGLNSEYYKIAEEDSNPYTMSKAYLSRNLKKDRKYILIDISRSQSKHGSKYKCGNTECCPITIFLSQKSKSYEQSLLFAGRVKAVIDEKYKSLPVQIITVDDDEYNQSRGYIGMLVEVGDAANTYDEAKATMRILCEAVKEVINETAK